MQLRETKHDHNIKKLDYAINFMNGVILDINKSGAIYQITTKADKFVEKTNGEIKLIHNRIKTIKTMEENTKQEKYFSELLKLLNDKINTMNEKFVLYSKLNKDKDTQ